MNFKVYELDAEGLIQSKRLAEVFERAHIEILAIVGGPGPSEFHEDEFESATAKGRVWEHLKDAYLAAQRAIAARRGQRPSLLGIVRTVTWEPPMECVEAINVAVHDLATAGADLRGEMPTSVLVSSEVMDQLAAQYRLGRPSDVNHFNLFTPVGSLTVTRDRGIADPGIAHLCRDMGAR